MIGKFFLSTSELIWCGEKISGDNVANFIQSFPQSEHLVDVVDVQPITSLNSGLIVHRTINYVFKFQVNFQMSLKIP